MILTGALAHPVDVHEGAVRNMWVPVGLSLLAGLSTGLGALIVWALDGPPSDQVLAGSLSLAGAVMTWVSVEMCALRFIYPRSGLDFAEAAGLLSVGFGIFMLLKRYLHGHGSAAEGEEAAEEGAQLLEEGAPKVEEGTPKDGERSVEHYWQLSVLMFVVLTAHNFPEGMAVAASAIDSKQLGIVVAVAIAAHNIPEGIVIAVPVYAATQSRWQALKYALCSGLSEPVGAFVTVVCLQGVITERLLEDVLCLVAGLMLGVSWVELFPDAYAYRQPLWALCGAILGCAVMAITDQVVH